MVGQKAEEEAGADGASGAAGTATSSRRMHAHPWPVRPWAVRGICPCGPSAVCGIDAAAAAGELELELGIACCLRIERRWLANG